MSERARRIGENEAIFRQVNEHVESLNRRLADVGAAELDIVCECGDITCIDRLLVPISSYEEIRSDSALFFVKRGHDLADVEDVVEHTDAYDVVRKHPGEAQRVAEETDPRA
ncbi:MAG: hypothetical protein QOH95_468 [Gaiellaceae bacterium]|nr:hypothetical protein [Gaiellaceae bacterium]